MQTRKSKLQYLIKIKVLWYLPRLSLCRLYSKDYDLLCIQDFQDIFQI
jgi:hypothetical protein